MKLKEYFTERLPLEPKPLIRTDTGSHDSDFIELCTRTSINYFHRGCMGVFKEGSDWFVTGDVPTHQDKTDEMASKLKPMECFVEDIHDHDKEKDIHFLCHITWGYEDRLKKIWEWMNQAYDTEEFFYGDDQKDEFNRIRLRNATDGNINRLDSVVR